jgi:hypothetical protein
LLGTYGDGRPYYALRFIRGDSLKEAIEHFRADAALQADPGRRSLELRKLLRRFLDVCNAIDYAHSRGVLHRDIKPGNVIVGKYQETLVVDWGLAKAVGRSDPGAVPDERPLVPSSLAETLPGSALGTPPYMSPEQAAGDLDRLGPRSDVYSLGATLYCLLTGKPPFLGDDAGLILRQVQQGAFSRPRMLDPSIDPALEAVCLKAMARRPEDRYGSPRALAEDIERWMADEPVSGYREPRVLAHHRLVLALRHLEDAQVERPGDPHLVLRVLVVVALTSRRAHLERAGRNPLEPDLPNPGREEFGLGPGCGRRILRLGFVLDRFLRGRRGWLRLGRVGHFYQDLLPAVDLERLGLDPQPGDTPPRPVSTPGPGFHLRLPSWSGTRTRLLEQPLHSVDEPIDVVMEVPSRVHIDRVAIGQPCQRGRQVRLARHCGAVD